MKKIIISDYDNTLYTDETNLLKNIEKIKEFRQKGNLFVIATGRSYQSLKVKIDEYSIPFDYIILSHGTVILNKDKKLILSYEIKKEIIENILQEITRFKNVIKSTKLFDVFKDDVKEITKSITKLRILTKTYEDALEISKYVNLNFSKDIKSYAIKTTKYIFVEIISINTDKSKAIEELLKIENIGNDEIYTIGDGSNDIEMIEKYNGYGMTNSENCVLERARKLYDNVYNLIEEII